MKTIKLILITALLMPIALMGQKGPFDDIFEKYQDSDDVTSISISMNAIHFNFGSGEEELNHLFKQVDKVNIIAFENHYKSFRDSDFMKEMNAIIEKNDYEQLVDIRSKDENVGIYIIEGDNELIKEGLIIAQDGEEATIISVRGNMNPSDFIAMKHGMPLFYQRHHSNKSFHF